MLRIGSHAPDFELLLTTKLRFRLSDHRDKNAVVLAFQPSGRGEATPREFQVFTDHAREIASRNALLLCVTNGPVVAPAPPDTSILIAVDRNLEVCRNYRVLWLGGKAIRRVTYVIDRHGVIRGVAHHELLVERHWTTVQRVLARLTEEHDIASYNRRAQDL